MPIQGQAYHHSVPHLYPVPPESPQDRNIWNVTSYDHKASAVILLRRICLKLFEFNLKEKESKQKEYSLAYPLKYITVHI